MTFAVIPAAEAAVTRHVGPYVELPRAFGAVATWAAGRGLEVVFPVRWGGRRAQPSPPFPRTESMKAKPQASPRPAPAVPPQYGLLSVLLLPIGLWWLARAGRKQVKGE